MSKTKKQKEEVLIDVKVISFEGEARLVEYRAEDGELARVTIPSGKVTQEGRKTTVAESVLKKGIPYGVEWSAFIKGKPFDSNLFQVNLRRAGVWTEADFNTATQQVTEAVARTLEVLLDQVRTEYYQANGQK